MRAVLLLCLAILSGCTTTEPPTERLKAGKYTVTTRHLGCPWSVCDDYEKTTVRFDGQLLDERFYSSQLGGGYIGMLWPSRFVFLPRRGMLVGVLKSGGSEMLVEFTSREGQPRLVPLAGCWVAADQQELSPSGLGPDACAEGNTSPGKTDVYSRKDAFSYHDAYWIDYAREVVHEIWPSVRTHEVVHVLGPTPDRGALLLVYRSYGKSGDFLLCAVRDASAVVPERCKPFTETAPPVPERRFLDPQIKAPVPSAHFVLRSLDDMAVTSAWREKLAAHFDFAAVGADGLPRARAVP